MKHCAPSRENIVFSCYSDNELALIARAYQIPDFPAKSGEKKEKVRILEEFFRRSGLCHDQVCWSEGTPGVSPEVIFRPPATWDRKGWLSNNDIDLCLAQYEEKYSTFAHLGTERVDFWYHTTNELRYPRFSDLLEAGKTKFSLAINLYGYAPKSKFERHWVCLFVDLTSHTIDFFDSSTFSIIPALEFLLYEIQLFLSLSLRKKIIFGRSMQALQKYDGDCGMFVLDFVIHRLSGMTFEGYLEFHRTLDISQREYMKELRKRYFR